MRGVGGIERWKDIERGGTASLTNIEVSETSARPQAPFVAVQGKKVPSLNLSKCLYFSLASIFPRDPRSSPPLCSWRRYLPEKCPENDILVHSPFNIFRVPHRHLRSDSALAFYARTLRLCTFLICRCSSDSRSLLFRQLRNACPSSMYSRSRLLEFRVTKTPRLLCMYAGIRCRGGMGYFLFHLNPPWWCLSALECGEHLAFLFKLYNSPMRFCGAFVTARRSEGAECTDFINIVIVKCLKEFYSCG